MNAGAGAAAGQSTSSPECTSSTGTIRSAEDPATAAETQSAGTLSPVRTRTARKTTSPSSPQKRRRRAPAPSVWVPNSLQGFNLVPEEFHKATPVPLPPVSPSQYEERDSWDENVGMTPYHPREWCSRPRLPGPAGSILGFGGQDVRNLDLSGEGGWVLGRVLVF